MGEEFFLQLISVLGVLFLLMFGVMSYFLKGIYENTSTTKTDVQLNRQATKNHEIRITNLEIDKAEIYKSLHDFKNDIGGRVGLLELHTRIHSNSGVV